MTLVHGLLEYCRRDGEPCPLSTDLRKGCNYDWSQRTGTYYRVECCRHPEKADAYNQRMARQKEYDDMFVAVFDIKGTIPEDEFEKKLAAVRLEVARKIDARSAALWEEINALIPGKPDAESPIQKKGQQPNPISCSEAKGIRMRRNWLVDGWLLSVCGSARRRRGRRCR